MNPLDNIEDRKSQTDIGILGSRIFMGALDETGSLLQAYLVTAAFFHGTMKAGNGDDE